MWAHGERYNEHGEWIPRLVLDEMTGQYLEPEDMPVVDDRPIRFTRRGKLMVAFVVACIVLLVGYVESVGTLP
jgi:hypothetical protein